MAMLAFNIFFFCEPNNEKYRIQERTEYERLISTRLGKISELGLLLAFCTISVEGATIEVKRNEYLITLLG